MSGHRLPPGGKPSYCLQGPVRLISGTVGPHMPIELPADSPISRMTGRCYGYFAPGSTHVGITVRSNNCVILQVKVPSGELPDSLR